MTAFFIEDSNASVQQKTFCCCLHCAEHWANREVLLDEPTYKVKRITVLPDKRLSYQKHCKREEHWTIVQGQALVTLDGQELTFGAGETVNIPRQAAHRIANPGPENLVFNALLL